VPGVRIVEGDLELVLRAAELFDSAPRPQWTRRFLHAPGHHLLLAMEGEQPVGFVSGVETTHPDKGTEMFLYELSVAPAHRRRGVATALVAALRERARERGCHGMWVGVEPGNEAALATYRAAGAGEPEAALVQEWRLGRPSGSARRT
jgi:ribosomal protein S18 acetylase RimI-like enzyme